MSIVSDAATKELEPGLKSRHGVKIGRPKSRHEKLVPVSTRCPGTIYTYLKGITPFRYPSLTEMFADMLRRFMDEKPWEHGLHWRKPKTALSQSGNNVGTTGWEQVNILLTPQLAEEVQQVAINCGVSKAAFCYTAIFWWVTFVFPPAQFKLK